MCRPVDRQGPQVLTGENPSRFVDDLRPVEQVTWQQACDFASQLSEQMSGQVFQLPTEAQWEYACRAGTQTALYSGPLEILGDTNAPALDPIAWYGGNSGHEFDHPNPIQLLKRVRQYDFGSAGTRRVKEKAPNPWGLYDMLGNVWEWCSDWNGEYSSKPQTDPVGPESGSPRVVRGGGWIVNARNVRSAFRNWYDPGSRFDALGFRCCLSSASPDQTSAAEPQSRPPNGESATSAPPRDEAASEQRTQ